MVLLVKTVVVGLMVLVIVVARAKLMMSLILLFVLMTSSFFVGSSHCVVCLGSVLNTVDCVGCLNVLIVKKTLIMVNKITKKMESLNILYKQCPESKSSFGGRVLIDDQIYCVVDRRKKTLFAC